MSEQSEEMIQEHELLEPHESDESARENAAALLWATGDSDNVNAAEAIWKDLKTEPATMKALKDIMLRSKKAQTS